MIGQRATSLGIISSTANYNKQTKKQNNKTLIEQMEERATEVPVESELLFIIFVQKALLSIKSCLSEEF